MVHAARNAKINGGIMRFSRSKMYHKKAAFVKNKKGEKAPAVKKVTILGVVAAIGIVHWFRASS